MNSDHDPELEAFLGGEPPPQDNVRKIKTYFLKSDQPAPQEIKPIDPESVEEVMPQELTEEVLAEYAKINDQIKGLEAVREELRARILNLMGREPSMLRGFHLCEVETRETTRTDYKRCLESQFDRDQLAEIVAPFVTHSQTKALKVRKVGQ